jgi:hypothetical protein
MSLILTSSDAWSKTFGIAFTFLIFTPALATGLILVAIVAARGEKARDAELEARWGRKRIPDE